MDLHIDQNNFRSLMIGGRRVHQIPRTPADYLSASTPKILHEKSESCSSESSDSSLQENRFGNLLDYENRKSNINQIPRDEFVLSSKSLASEVGSQKPLMGYDWIAGMLDNSSFMERQPDDYFNEIKDFRTAYQDECVHPAESFVVPSCENDVPRVLTDGSGVDQAVDEFNACQSAYVLNNRFQPVALHGPYSDCTLCKAGRSKDIDCKDKFVRVTVPRSCILSPYRIRPHRRSSYDPSDSVALSKHCLAGWQNSQPACPPCKPSVDLKSNLHVAGTKENSVMRGLLREAVPMPGNDPPALTVGNVGGAQLGRRMPLTRKRGSRPR